MAARRTRRPVRSPLHLQALESRLAPGATVVLDDVERPGEQEVLRRWEQETGLAFDRSLESGGVAVARMAAVGPGGGHG